MSTKEYGCFFCDSKSILYSGLCDKCGKPINIDEQLINTVIEEYHIVRLIGRGFYGWTYKVESESSFQMFSMKIIPRHRVKKPLGSDEVKALASCSAHRNIARFWRQLTTNLKIFDVDINVICLLFDYVPKSKTLKNIIQDKDFAPSRNDVVSILSGIASGLSKMHSLGIQHHDLHDDNILIRQVDDDENLDENFESKLIDFGSVKPISDPEEENRSDFEYFGKHILSLISKFELENETKLTPTDHSFTREFRILAQRLLDKDISRRNLTPRNIYGEIKNILEKCTSGFNYPTFSEMKEQNKLSFTEPLSNTNALTLQPQDINLLFIDALEWTTRIEKSEPVFILGPRGCGKTMLLRYLSIESQARPLKEETRPQEVANRLNKMQYVGFLISIGQLRTPFFRSSYKKLDEYDKNLAEDFCREFINAECVYEVIRMILWLKTEKLIEIDENDVKTFIRSLKDIVESENEKELLKYSLEELAERIDRRIVSLSNLPDPQKYKSTNYCREDILLIVANALKTISWMKNKEIWFLFDDYSITLLPSLAQRAYNPVLFRLSSEFKVKISSEGEGPILEDTMFRKYKEGREFTKVDLGEIYFQADEERGKKFFEQILEARFNETKKGSLSEIKNMLGEHDNEERFGKYICSSFRPGDAQFYGFGLICRLCSGDVSFILELLNLIAGENLGKQSKKKLSNTDIDSITKRFAQRQLADLKSIAKRGTHLYLFALNFGDLIKGYLLQSCNKRDADERLRIEVEGSGELSPEAQEFHYELLRHSVLINGGSGKNRAGLPTKKLFFRRLFAPCFPFSPSRKGSIAIDFKTYEQWLLDPKKIIDKLNYVDSKNQMDIFEN
jgi:serine/threonine protein kinase